MAERAIAQEKTLQIREALARMTCKFVGVASVSFRFVSCFTYTHKDRLDKLHHHTVKLTFCRTYNGGGKHLRLGGGGVNCLCACVSTQMLRGLWACSSRKILQIRCSESASEDILAQSGTTVIIICASSYVVQRVQTSEFPKLSTV